MKVYHKSEAMDIIESMCIDRFQPAIFFTMFSTSKVDKNILKESLLKVASVIPQIYCLYDYATCNFYGEEKNIDNIIIETDEKPMFSFEKHPQLRIWIRDEKIVFCSSHMLCDGQGLKELVTIILDVYAAISLNQPHDLTEYRNVRNLFELTKKKPKLRKNASLSKIKHPLSFSPNKEEKEEEQLLFILKGEVFLALKEHIKKYDATINDVVMCAYVRGIQKLTGKNDISIGYPYDLRKYMSKAPLTVHVANYVGDYVCNVTLKENETFMETLLKVKTENETQKLNNENSLYDIRLLMNMSSILPLSFFKKGIRMVMQPCNLSMTNFGLVKEHSIMKQLHVTNCILSGSFRTIDELQISVSSFHHILNITMNVIISKEDIKVMKQLMENMKSELLNAI